VVLLVHASLAFTFRAANSAARNAACTWTRWTATSGRRQRVHVTKRKAPRMKKWALVLAAMLAVVGMILATIGLLRSKTDQRKALSPLPAESGTTRDALRHQFGEELQDLKREIAQVRMQVSRAAEPASRGDHVLTEATREAPLDPEELRARSGLVLARYKETLDTAMLDQVRDNRWAFETEQKIESAVASVSAIATLQEARCAATLCRATLQLKEGMARRDLVNAVKREDPFTGGTFYSYDGLLATLYVTKEGSNFPPEADLNR